MARKGENIYLRKDGRWEGRYASARDERGKIKYGYVYGKSYKEAKEKLIVKKASSFVEYRRSVHKSDIKTVGDWIEIWRNNIVKYQVKESTYASYTHKLKKYASNRVRKIKLSQLKKSDLEELIVDLKGKELSNRTINTFLQILGECIQSAKQRGYISDNPCKQVKRLKSDNKEIKALSTMEQLVLEELAQKEQYGIIILLPLFTGMRIGGISALEWEDIDFENKLIRVNKTLQRISKETGKKAKTEITIGTTKSNKVRYIPISDRLFKILKKYKGKDCSEKYVVTCRNSYVEPRLITYHFKRILKKAEMNTVTYHALRHTFATRCIEKGVDVATLCHLLGHESAKTTLDIYTDSMLEQRRVAISKLDSLEN